METRFFIADFRMHLFEGSSILNASLRIMREFVLLFVTGSLWSTYNLVREVVPRPFLVTFMRVNLCLKDYILIHYFEELVMLPIDLQNNK